MTALRGVFVLAAIIITLGAVSVAGYMWYTNQGLFQGDRISGVPTGHIKVDHAQASHLDLLFSNYGGVSYNFVGEWVSVYIAYYERDELVLRERVNALGTAEPYELSGSVIWGITIEEGLRRELRVRISSGGAVSVNYFDFSQIDFVPGLFVNSPEFNNINSRPIELGRRYALQVWQTGNSWRADNYAFNPEQLRDSEKTTILYIVFE